MAMVMHGHVMTCHVMAMAMPAIATRADRIRRLERILEGLLRLAVRTSRCGRDNPGSNPGEDKLLHVFHSCFRLKKDPFLT